MSRDVYRFGSFELDARRARVMRGGAEVALRPKAFALLQYLLANADRVVTRDELLGALWPGVIVTEDSLTRCVSDLRSALGDAGQELIRTVAKRGYRFAARVDTDRVAPPHDAARVEPQRQAPSVGDPGVLRRWRRPAWVVALLVVVAGLAWQGSRLARPAGPQPLTLVVLPFAAVGDDRSQPVLADLVTEGLTVALARLHGASVIAAGTARTYAGQPTDLRALGAELGVRYALQGSVVRSGRSLRVSTLLVDTGTAKTVWSDQVDLDPANLLKAQDEIVLRVAHATAAELVRDASQITSQAQPTDLGAEDLALQCEAASRVKQGESGAPSFELCERALLLDPRNARALVRLAMYHGDRVERMQSPDPQGDLLKARGWVDRARDVAPGYDAVHCAHAVVLSAEGRLPEAIVAAERCVELNPSNAYGYRILAALHFFLVEPERTLAYVDKGMRLSPRDPQRAGFMLFKGWALLQMQRDEEALVWLRQAAATSLDSPSILAPLIATLALTGRDEEAKATLAHYLSLPRARNRAIVQWDARPGRNAAFQRFSERFKDGLRKAGMPER